MLTRENFKDFIINITSEEKAEILKSDCEYSFIELNSYGDYTITQTDDNNGEIMEIIQSDEWSGLEYLVYNAEIIEILGEK